MDQEYRELLLSATELGKATLRNHPDPNWWTSNPVSITKELEPEDPDVAAEAAAIVALDPRFSTEEESGVADRLHQMMDYKWAYQHARVEWEPGRPVTVASFGRGRMPYESETRLIIEELWTCGHHHRVPNERCWSKGKQLASEFRQV